MEVSSAHGIEVKRGHASIFAERFLGDELSNQMQASRSWRLATLSRRLPAGILGTEPGTELFRSILTLEARPRPRAQQSRAIE